MSICEQWGLRAPLGAAELYREGSCCWHVKPIMVLASKYLAHRNVGALDESRWEVLRILLKSLTSYEVRRFSHFRFRGFSMYVICGTLEFNKAEFILGRYTPI